jgi:hypothetical protein
MGFDIKAEEKEGKIWDLLVELENKQGHITSLLDLLQRKLRPIMETVPAGNEGVEVPQTEPNVIGARLTSQLGNLEDIRRTIQSCLDNLQI